jgi:hypothetical protein
MPSRALQQFVFAKRRARRLAVLATDRRLRPLTYDDMEPSLHAALAAYVSGWEAYVEDVTLEFLNALVGAMDPKASAFAKTLHDEAERVVKRFNTPTFDESRNLLYRFTGCDPFTVMMSSRLKMTTAQTQTRLDEILRVRHAFAHGRPLPNFRWLTRYAHSSRLSQQAVKGVDVLLTDLVEGVDVALSAYALTTFGVNSLWR